MKQNRMVALRRSLKLEVAPFATLFGVSTSTAYRWEQAGKALRMDGAAAAILLGYERAIMEAGSRVKARLREYAKHDGLEGIVRDGVLGLSRKEGT